MVRLLVLHVVHPSLAVGHPMLLLAPRLLLLVLVMLMWMLLAWRSGARVVNGPRVVVSGVRSRLLLAVESL